MESSPIVSMSQAYLKQANQLWYQIYQIVQENCSTPFKGNPHEDAMERLLSDAEKLSGKKFDISNFADITEAIHIIQEDMGIAGTTALEASETIAGSISSTKSAIGNLLAGLGNANADIGMLVDNVVDSFGNVVKNVTPVVENLAAALPDAISKVIPAIGSLLPTLVSTAGSVFPADVDSDHHRGLDVCGEHPDRERPSAHGGGYAAPDGAGAGYHRGNTDAH